MPLTFIEIQDLLTPTQRQQEDLRAVTPPEIPPPATAEEAVKGATVETVEGGG